MFAAPPVLQTTVFTRLPDTLRIPQRRSEWVDQRGAGSLHSFLEGPSFDRHGYLWCVDVAHARIFRISPAGEWEVFTEYEGCPNGLKIHRDGRLFVTDRQRGLLSFDPHSRRMTVVLGDIGGRPFNGPNDLVFASNGDLYFTDPGESSLREPNGAVFRLRADGKLDMLCDGLPGPNGLVLNLPENALYVAMTLSNSIVRIPLKRDHGGIGRVGTFIQLSGGLAGPDGMAMDRDGNIAVVHAGFGVIWVFSAFGEPLWRIQSCAGIRTTNVAYGGPNRQALFITEAEHGAILRAELPVPGLGMFSGA